MQDREALALELGATAELDLSAAALTANRNSAFENAARPERYAGN
jgi:hypothetical protein